MRDDKEIQATQNSKTRGQPVMAGHNIRYRTRKPVEVTLCQFDSDLRNHPFIGTKKPPSLYWGLLLLNERFKSPFFR